MGENIFAIFLSHGVDGSVIATQGIEISDIFSLTFSPVHNPNTMWRWSFVQYYEWCGESGSCFVGDYKAGTDFRRHAWQ